MLETIREFARENLEGADEVEMMRDRHARFYRVMASRAGPALDGGTGSWLGVLDSELENMRATLSWFLGRKDFEAAQDVVGSIGRYWIDRGSLSELRGWLDRSLAGGQRHGAASVGAVNWLSWVVYLQGDYEHARATAVEALDAARAVGDPMRSQFALTNLANALEAMDLLDEAGPIEEEVLQICRDLRVEHPRQLTLALINISYSALIRGRYEDVVGYASEAISLARAHGDSLSEAVAGCNLAVATLRLGRIDQAADLIREAMATALGASDRLLQVDCLEVLARIEVERGSYRSAARLLGTSAALRQDLKYELQPAERALHEEIETRIRSELPEPELTRAWSEGATLDAEESLALATSLAEDS